MRASEWARLQADVKCPLRRGAWYRVIRLGAREVTLDVGRAPLAVTRSFLEFRSTPPSRWSVVSDPRNAAGVPENLADYAVCPSCRDRAPLVGRPEKMRCPRCNGFFEVAWDERTHRE